MNEITITNDKTIEEIKSLHNELLGAMKRTLEIAYRIGELLYYKKLELEHGEFIPWVNNNMPFTRYTAFRYITIYENKKQLEENNILYLSQAYKFLKCCTVQHLKTATVAVLPSPDSEDSEEEITGEITELTEDDLNEKDKEIERLKDELDELKTIKKNSKKEIEELRRENIEYKNILGQIKSMRDIIVKIQEIDKKDTDESLKEIAQAHFYIKKSTDFFLKNTAGIEELPVTKLTIKALSNDVKELLNVIDKWGVRLAKRFKIKLNSEEESDES